MTTDPNKLRTSPDIPLNLITPEKRREGASAGGNRRTAHSPGCERSMTRAKMPKEVS